MYKSPLGMNDILPEEVFLWQDIEDKARKIFHLYGYTPIRTPILEDYNLFNRSLGDQTEIVKKQMFVIKRQDEEYCLRPEGTAAIVRAYIENNLDKKNGFMKLYYIGPMFRAERPQKGRLRQFHHIGIEAIGSSSPYLDSEVISLADTILKGSSINGHLIKINSLGCLKDKQLLAEILQKRLKDSQNELCEDCRERLNRNIFRILDCKNEGCQRIVSGLKLEYSDYLCPDCHGHFNAVQENLDALKVPYQCQITLVRGLDYYTRTVFEITHSSLGAQDAIGAGGRYDNLVNQLGGPDLGAIGFALGVERMLLATNINAQEKTLKIKIFIITLDAAAKKAGFILLNSLRDENIPSDIDYEDKSLKSQMRKANDLGVKFTLLLGENELAKKVVAVKDMETGKQEEIGINDIIIEMKRRLC